MQYVVPRELLAEVEGTRLRSWVGGRRRWYGPTQGPGLLDPTGTSNRTSSTRSEPRGRHVPRRVWRTSSIRSNEPSLWGSKRIRCQSRPCRQVISRRSERSVIGRTRTPGSASSWSTRPRSGDTQTLDRAHRRSCRRGSWWSVRRSGRQLLGALARLCSWVRRPTGRRAPTRGPLFRMPRAAGVSNSC